MKIIVKPCSFSGELDVEFDSLFADRLSRLIDILCSFNYKKVFDYLYKHMNYDEFIKKRRYKVNIDDDLSIDISNDHDIIMMGDVTIDLLRSGLKENLYESVLYDDIEIRDKDRYSISLSFTYGNANREINTLINSLSSINHNKEIGIKNILQSVYEKLKPCIINITNRSKLLFYISNSLHMVRVDEDKMTREEKENDFVVGYNGQTEINIHKLFKNTIVLQYKDNTVDLGDIDNSMKSAKFIVNSNKEFEITI